MNNAMDAKFGIFLLLLREATIMLVRRWKLMDQVEAANTVTSF